MMTTDFDNKAFLINLLLHDGDPNGTREADIDQSRTRAIGFRRRRLPELDSRVKKMMSGAGVYILMAGDDGDTRKAYIGESEHVLQRLQNHFSNATKSNSTKDFWEDTIALVSKDENLTKAHAMFAESRLLSEVGNNRRWTFPNVQRPSDTAGGLPHAARVSMESFVKEAKILVGVLGCEFFVPSQSSKITLQHPTKVMPIHRQ